jgi:hypothetical protein
VQVARDVSFPHAAPQPAQVGVTVSNPGNATLSFAASVVPAAVVQQRLALLVVASDGGYATGDTIAGARWFQSTNGNDVAGDQMHQYYLLPDGTLLFWDGHKNDTGASTLVDSHQALHPKVRNDMTGRLDRATGCPWRSRTR